MNKPDKQLDSTSSPSDQCLEKVDLSWCSRSPGAEAEQGGGSHDP